MTIYQCPTCGKQWHKEGEGPIVTMEILPQYCPQCYFGGGMPISKASCAIVWSAQACADLERRVAKLEEIQEGTNP